MRQAMILPALILAGAVTLPAASLAQEITIGEGAQVYAATCSRCHNARAPNERSDREWGVIVNHMRIRGNLTGREARAVLYFLQLTNGVDGPSTSAVAVPPRRILARAPIPGTAISREDTPEPPSGPNPGFLGLAPWLPDTSLAAKGEKLVEQQGCMACHKVGKFKTGTVGPDLNTVVARRGAEFILKKLADPKFDNPASIMPQMNLAPEQRQAILAYLSTLGKK